ncbi:sodium:proton antiporter [Sporosarcina sp. BI001-red]|uniref:cation:proton antiporter n=1 Tax=Sporosarcina sp. BI001-red TaxID=2282866 RepID=UPI000E2421DE|nr:sodium:proton antiporter [Sporosarcina sp. BI001-red]REB05971.1 sodium:proton antiporter [Sporosarcina sp. BI001-red]
MFGSIAADLMLVVFIGILSQWVAWRYRLPAIVVMAIAGLIVGPVFGFINPKETLGELFSPIISFAVAIILFEGSLNLDFREIKGFSKPLMRIVTFGAFIAWVAGSLAAHYLAGLSWTVAFIIGGLFIVTGPTVILPMLRQAKLKPRAAALLKWEGIIVDPFGALLAVFAFEFIKFVNGQATFAALGLFVAASAFAVFVGWASARILGYAFEKGLVPEFLKAPVLFAVVLFTFVVSDELMHETGLLAVTAMGIVMANMHLTSIHDIRQFKENISVLLISGIFVMLTASLNPHVLIEIFDWHIITYVAAMLFVVRPLSIWISTVGTDLSNREKNLIGWVAPRGIVALTVSGYFASILLENGYKDAELLTALTFALVLSTVVLHGFTIGPFARRLNLTTTDESGVLFVGGTRFAAELAQSIQDTGNEVLLMDTSWAGLSHARNLGLSSHVGDILTEQTEYTLDLSPYRYMLAMTKADTYNAHICADFLYDVGRQNLFQTKFHVGEGVESFNVTGGRTLFTPALSIYDLEERMNSGHVFRKTVLSKQYGYTQYLRERDDRSVLLYILREDGSVEFYTPTEELQAVAGDTIVALSHPIKQIERAKERIADEKGEEEVQHQKIEMRFSEDHGKTKSLIPGEAPPPIQSVSTKNPSS